jgi:type VI secretion system secreted protein Hcp
LFLETVAFSSINNNNPTPINSFSLGASNSGGGGVGGGAGTGKVDFSDVSISKLLDATSLELLKAAATGAHIPTAQIEVSEVGASMPFAKYLFTDVLVTADVIGANGNAINEQVTLNFSRISADVTVGGQTFHSCYDLKKGTSC